VGRIWSSRAVWRNSAVKVNRLDSLRVKQFTKLTLLQVIIMLTFSCGLG